VRLAGVYLTSHTHRRFPDKLAFLLNNRVRRLLAPPDQLISRLGVRSNDVAVDFGCGPGFYTIPLAKVARRVIAVDVSPKMLEKVVANAKKHHTSVNHVQSDGSKIELENASVDVILLVHVFHEIGEKATVLGEFKRILRDAGRLVIVERAKGNVFSRKFGAPIMNVEHVISEVKQEAFILAQRISLGDDAILIFQKTGNGNSSHT
jgi:ubiquinone/menaquinone biosynthesis C-methylase UbiE